MSGQPVERDRTLAIADAEALRDHLNDLNSTGTDFRAVGMDARGAAFLIALSGCYADTEVVLYGDPWDGEVEYGTGRRCDECNAQELHPMESLRFPVLVILRATSPDSAGDPR